MKAGKETVNPVILDFAGTKIKELRL